MEKSLICLVIFLLIGCSGSTVVDTIINPPVVPPKVDLPVIGVSIRDTTLVYGDSITVNWSMKGATYETLQGQVVTGTSGSLNLLTLLRDTIINFSATNSTGNSIKSLSVKVGDWGTSLFGTMTHGKWESIKRNYLINEKKEIITIYDLPFTEAYEFSNKWEVTSYIDGIYFSKLNYFFVDGSSSLKYGSTVRIIEKISKDSLFLLTPDAINPKTRLFRDVYVHPKE